MFSRFAFVASCFLCLVSAAAFAEDKAALIARGEKIFQDQCASCHGQRGEGVEGSYEHGLFGDKSTVDLSEYIAETMPEGEEDLCVGKDAEAVAVWMQQAFYSPEAQAKINPPGLKPVRLTVDQYRYAIADLQSSFSWFNEPNEKQGLDAVYFKHRNMNSKYKAIERLDAEVDFDFKNGTPDKKKIPQKKEGFSIRWEGSLVVDETGWYDFVVKTPNAIKLFVNDSREPLLDAWVKSGKDDEFRGSRFMLAGKLYPLRLDWFTWREDLASVKLLWKKPHGHLEVIPRHNLSPQRTTSVLAIETPFPPDDRSDGYVRGTSISPEWHEATTFAAIEAVDKLTPRLAVFAKLKKEDNEKQRRDKLIAFCRTFLLRAFRRPPSEAEQNLYVDSAFAEGVDTSDAVRRCLLLILKSPRFLYRNVTQSEDLYTRASRLSFALVNSTPHSDLLKAAEKQWIKSDRPLRDYAWRMANSFQSRTHLRKFLRVWLNLERIEESTKDSELFKGFNDAVFADMRTSLELLLREAVEKEKGGFQQLLTSRQTWLNARLAGFYELDHDPKDSNAFRLVDFQADQRSGIVSHPFLMTALAYRDVSSPIHRGVFLSRGLLGRTMKPPPDSVSPVAPDLEPHLTTRQRVQKQTSAAVCANCHKMINALGFALEEFDAVGRLRDAEKEKKIDASGQYRSRDGELVKFTGARQLGEFLLKNPDTHRSFVRQLFHYMVGQPILAYDAEMIDRLADFFVENDFDMKKLMVEIAVISATQTPKKNS